VNPADFASDFSHKNESAHPGYYQVYLERYGINAELTSTLRTGYHRYTYRDNAQSKKPIVNLAVSNERIKDWNLWWPEDRRLLRRPQRSRSGQKFSDHDKVVHTFHTMFL